MSTQNYRCPVCKKPLTKKEYERALHIHEAAEEERLKWKEERRKFKANEKKIRKDAKEAARKQFRRTEEGLVTEIRRLKEKLRARQLAKSQQEFGPEFEIKLLTRLKQEFATDEIERTKGSRCGDILHLVKEGGKVAGTIIYECKWTPRLSGSHVRQTAYAKRMRNAQFGVLVTSGTKRGFKGLGSADGVMIVSPDGVLVLAGLLRSHLAEMFRAGVEKRRRTKIANQLLRFIKTPEFKNPVEDVVQAAESLRLGITEEFEWHKENWEKRWDAYGRIRWDAFAVRENIRRVLNGEPTKQMAFPKERLALPGVQR